MSEHCSKFPLILQVFFLWSADSWECLHHMFLPFPAFFILGHRPKFTLSPMYTDEDQILITCSQWFVQLISQQYPLINQTKEELIEKETLDDNTQQENIELELCQLLTSSVVTDVTIPTIQNKEMKKWEPDDPTKRMMRRLVADGGPHWALKMHPLEDIDLVNFPTWQKVNKIMMEATAAKKSENAAEQLAKRMVTLKASIAFRKLRKS
uniref:Uncharacterized protein n=1 Tax=Strigamia maritima TaxID=126957 RepID=T1JIE8_STRMM